MSKNDVYHCNKCSGEYPFYMIDDLTIIDFNSLNMTNCECNRDGITTCKIDLMHQLPTNLPENETVFLVTKGGIQDVKGEYLDES